MVDVIVCGAGTVFWKRKSNAISSKGERQIRQPRSIGHLVIISSSPAGRSEGERERDGLQHGLSHTSYRGDDDEETIPTDVCPVGSLLLATSKQRSKTNKTWRETRKELLQGTWAWRVFSESTQVPKSHLKSSFKCSSIAGGIEVSKSTCRANTSFIVLKWGKVLRWRPLEDQRANLLRRSSVAANGQNYYYLNISSAIIT